MELFKYESIALFCDSKKKYSSNDEVSEDVS